MCDRPCELDRQEQHPDKQAYAADHKQAGGGPTGPLDPSVTYDAWHGARLISSLMLLAAGRVHGSGVVTSRSTDGGKTWGNPVPTASGSDVDKNWIVCDNTASSAFYGRCTRSGATTILETCCR